jgi:hypothetical protein
MWQSAALSLALIASCGCATSSSSSSSAGMIRDGWIRPADADDAEPIWGIDGGIRVGVWPAGGGPRGLIRIYAPYLNNPPGQVINFIAVEPIVDGRRAFSELERSSSDRQPGKMMWMCDEMPDDAKRFVRVVRPARGKVITIDGVEALSFFIVVEQFDNGAQPIVQVILRKDHPHEVTFRTWSARDAAKMDACVLTATMGNYARLRRLLLKDRTVEAKKVWPNFESKDAGLRGFARHAEWRLDDMIIRRGVAEVSATPDEADPSRAAYAPGTPDWWKYSGKPGVQRWRAPAQDALVVRVNARRVYWGSACELPGGVAFENFEMQAPFAAGQEFTFSVDALDR